MKLTKFDMAKVIVTALYNLPELVTENNRVAWKHAQRIARNKKELLLSDHEKAVKIIQNRMELKENNK